MAVQYIGLVHCSCCDINTICFYLRSIQQLPKDEVLKQVERLKLPGELGEMTGAVLYPDEVTSKWDDEGLCDLDVSEGRADLH